MHVRSYLVIAIACATAVSILLIIGQEVGAQVTRNKSDKVLSAPHAQATPTVSASPPGPQRVETIMYDSWSLTCHDTVGTGAKKTCSARLQVVDQKSRQTLLAWVIGRDNKGVLTTVLQTPTGVLIDKGVEIKLGDGATRRMEYLLCLAQRCEASGAMDAAIIKEIRAATSATVTIYATDGRAITFSMTIKGIDKVMATLERYS